MLTTSSFSSVFLHDSHVQEGWQYPEAAKQSQYIFKHWLFLQLHDLPVATAGFLGRATASDAALAAFSFTELRGLLRVRLGLYMPLLPRLGQGQASSSSRGRTRSTRLFSAAGGIQSSPPAACSATGSRTRSTD